MTTSAAASVRLATVEDADAIARVHLASHREAYVATGRIPSEVVEAWTLALRQASQRDHLTRQAAGTPEQTFVAEVGGDVVGFSVAGPSHDDDREGGWALYAIYLLEAQHGTGLGQALLEAALGERAASLWVLAENPRAHAFYTRNGFFADGAEKVDPQWGNVPEVRLVRTAQSE
mgnify:FL=1